MKGYAHVVKEDLVNRDLLFVGTEFGLWVSLDGGKQWAQYKGGEFPNVAVRDLAIHPRDDDSRHRHARPRHLDHRRHHAPALADAGDAREGGRVRAGAGRRSSGFRPRAAGSTATPRSTGRIRPSEAQITYYQQKRHIFGDLKIEVLGPDGKVLEQRSPASKRRGLIARRLVHALEGAARADGGHRRFRRRHRPARPARARTRSG